jgi:hypothetical protein
LTLDKHHLVLYGVLLVVSLCALGVLHEWRMDVATAKAKAAAQEQIIAANNKADADRQKQFEQTAAAIDALKVKPGAMPQQIIERIPQLIQLPGRLQLEPVPSVIDGKLQEPKPDAPKPNLVFDPAQQVVLVNRLTDCKVCDAEREKLKADLASSKSDTAAMTKERDDWKTAAKGGSLWTRIKRRAWAFAEDVVIIEGARCVAGHC